MSECIVSKSGMCLQMTQGFTPCWEGCELVPDPTGELVDWEEV